MRLNKPEEEMTVCTTIRISLETRCLLTEVRAQHILRDSEDLKTYNQIIRYLYEVWKKSEE